MSILFPVGIHLGRKSYRVIRKSITYQSRQGGKFRICLNGFEILKHGLSVYFGKKLLTNKTFISMATYQQLFDQVNSEISLADENHNLFEVCTKLSELNDLYFQFSYELMSELDYSNALDNFNLAYENANTFKKYYQEIVLQKTFADGSEELEKLGVLFKNNEVNQLKAIAYSNFSLALFHNINRNPGLAATHFEKADKSFQDLANKSGSITDKILANYCNALKSFAEAMEDFFRASFANAKTKCQRAKILLENIIEKELEPLKDEKQYKDFYDQSINLFKADYQTIKSYYFISDAKYQFNNRNFKNALKQFSNVVAEADLSLKNYLNSSDNENMKNLTWGEYHNYLGWQLLSEAEVFRESENWDKAFGNYELVRKEWENASSYYLLSGHPSASALQESVLNAALTVDVYQAVCENEMQLKEKISNLQNEIDELKERLFNAIKPMGIIVNNTQDVVTTVEQNAQFIQNIENNAREGVKELLGTLKDSGLDDAAKKKIETNGTEILQSKETGHKFLDKVKGFTKDVAEIIKNVGDIAGPIIPAFKFLAMLI